MREARRSLLSIRSTICEHKHATSPESHCSARATPTQTSAMRVALILHQAFQLKMSECMKHRRKPRGEPRTGVGSATAPGESGNNSSAQECGRSMLFNFVIVSKTRLRAAISFG